MRLFLLIILIGIAFASQTQPIINKNVLANAIVIEESEINTESFEFSPVIYDSYVAFVNDRGRGVNYDQVHNTPYFDLSFAAANLDGNLARKASFMNTLSSEMQEGPFDFSKDLKTIYFTRTDPITGKLGIYFSENENNTWKPALKLDLSPANHECHPSLSASGKWMVFAGSSEEDDNMDLYIVQKSDGGWSDAFILNESINSSANDWFPRFVGDSIIIFASDRIGGKGGLDMYAIKWANQKWTDPILLPSPLNSESDDFGLVIGEEIAFFSSNRAGGKGKDDLYRIEYKGSLIYDPNSSLLDVTLHVKNKLTMEEVSSPRVLAIPVSISEDDQQPLMFDIDLATQPFEDDALVLKLKPKPSLPKIERVGNESGQIRFKVANNQRYAFKISAPGYADYAALYSFKDYGADVTYVLEPVEDNPDGTDPNESRGKIIIPTTAGSVVIFDQIYYDFNSHIISEGAASELDALAIAMRQNPSMSIRLSAHTDSRGTKIYNQRLSEKRALSAKNYLIRKGINGNRIEAIGFGELRLRNNCGDNVPCNEDQHRFNRRTEVKIISN